MNPWLPELPHVLAPYWRPAGRVQGEAQGPEEEEELRMFFHPGAVQAQAPPSEAGRRRATRPWKAVGFSRLADGGIEAQKDQRASHRPGLQPGVPGGLSQTQCRGECRGSRRPGRRGRHPLGCRRVRTSRFPQCFLRTAPGNVLWDSGSCRGAALATGCTLGPQGALRGHGDPVTPAAWFGFAFSCAALFFQVPWLACSGS